MKNVGLCSLVVFVGCGGAASFEAESGSGEGERTGSVSAAIEAVPAGVACIRLGLTGALKATKDFAVTPGQPSKLDIGKLPPGNVTISGSAFAVACTAVTNATEAGWVADPSTVDVKPGLTTDVALVLRPNVKTTVNVDFVQPVKAIAAGQTTTYALMPDGTVRAWGGNQAGQLGVGDTSVHAGIVTLPLAGVKRIASKGSHACAIVADGSAWCWGGGTAGQLGNGAVSSSATPVRVVGDRGINHFFKSITVGYMHTCGIDTNDATLCWGSNASGQLGDGTTVNRSRPVIVDTTKVFHGVYAMLAHTCAIDNDARAYCWGSQAGGAFGNGQTVGLALSPVDTQFVPVLGLSGGFTPSSTNFSCALIAAGSAMCSGANFAHALGDGTSTDKSFPVAVTGVSNLVAIEGGNFHTCGLRKNGTVTCWGEGGLGARGNGSAANISTATNVLDLANATAIAAGGSHTCALRDDGTVVCWGSNSSGQLGDGTKIRRYTPTLVQF